MRWLELFLTSGYPQNVLRSKSCRYNDTEALFVATAETGSLSAGGRRLQRMPMSNGRRSMVHRHAALSPIGFGAACTGVCTALPTRADDAVASWSWRSEDRAAASRSRSR